MKGGFDRNKTLQELEKQDWGQPNCESSLVKTCYRLRQKPLNEFTLRDLRVMIGQQISLPILVPLAVEQLEADVLAEGSYYPGDLLAAVFNVDETFWSNHADSLQRLRRVVERARDELPFLDEITSPRIEKLLEDAPRSFIST